ncbi:MAG: Bro-N domain-containing protein [Nanoarchaeales archaeon]|nr:Bro-N domain-containing protein [Nanoarchaeales archaeon]
MEEIINFENQKIRRMWHDEEWYFSVVDIIRVLTDSKDAKDYWYRLKKRELEQGVELSTNCRQLKLKATDGKLRVTDCVSRKGLLRIIQSVPSKKAEPFKQWLAQVGEDRLLEIENPELAQQRVKEYYEVKGYSKGWIEKRLRGIAVREELTDEWKNRGIEQSQEFAILTNEISKATFDKSIKEHKNHKGIIKPNQNLRDHMTDLELIFSMLGEASTTQISKDLNSQGFNENLESARKGGNIAKNAIKELEKESTTKVVSSNNYLNLDKTKKIN